VPEFLTVFALIGIVLTLSALASGIVVRAPISFPILFLGLGFLLGKHGLGIISMGPHDHILEAVATVSLAFVLFLDAVRLRLDELGKNWFIPILVLDQGLARLAWCARSVVVCGSRACAGAPLRGRSILNRPGRAARCHS
jgi:NhaP-type Na+/H+ or K+/H+ antiporter